MVTRTTTERIPPRSIHVHVGVRIHLRFINGYGNVMYEEYVCCTCAVKFVVIYFSILFVWRFV